MKYKSAFDGLFREDALALAKRMTKKQLVKDYLQSTREYLSRRGHTKASLLLDEFRDYREWSPKDLKDMRAVLNARTISRVKIILLNRARYYWNSMSLKQLREDL